MAQEHSRHIVWLGDAFRTLVPVAPLATPSNLPNVGDAQHRAIRLSFESAAASPQAGPAIGAIRSKGASRMSAFRTLNRGTEPLIDVA